MDYNKNTQTNTILFVLCECVYQNSTTIIAPQLSRDNGGTNGTPSVETHNLRNKVSLKFTSIGCAWHQIDFDTAKNVQQGLQMLGFEILIN